MLKKIKGTQEVLKGKEIVLSMDDSNLQEYAMNWLSIYNNVRENKNIFLQYTCSKN